MLPDQPFGIFAVGSCFRPEAGRIGRKFTGQEGFIDDLRLYAAALGPELIMDIASGSGGGYFLALTGISRDDGGAATITWNSRPGRIYAIDFSNDLKVWNEINDSFPSEGDSTSYVDDVFAPLNPLELYYRVREN